MMTIDDNTRLVQKSALPTGQIDGELMALDSRRGEVLGLDTVGTTIWSMLAEPQTLADLLAQIVERFEVEPEEARRDVVPFLADLIDAGLIGPAE